MHVPCHSDGGLASPAALNRVSCEWVVLAMNLPNGSSTHLWFALARDNRAFMKFSVKFLSNKRLFGVSWQGSVDMFRVTCAEGVWPQSCELLARFIEQNTLVWSRSSITAREYL